MTMNGPLPTDWRSEWKPLLWVLAVFVGFYWLPIESTRVQGAVMESLALTRWYAREHVLLCLVPAFYIAGAISVFLDQQAVLKYLGPGAPKLLSYGVASVAGMILAVCSCTVLPLFAGIYTTGAGLGPASAFLYSGPAISVLAVVLTASVLGISLGLARALGAVFFSIVIGLLMHAFFRKDEAARIAAQPLPLHDEEAPRGLIQNAVYFALMVGILIFANWGRPQTDEGLWFAIYHHRWMVTAALAASLGIALVKWFGLGWSRLALIAIPTLMVGTLFPDSPTLPFVTATLGLSLVTSTSDGELGDWFAASWGFAKQILPLLFVGILIAGLLLGRPGQEGLVPSEWISGAVGGNSLGANLFASVAGAFMYFATLTEVPILQGLLGNGMGRGPALALLLAGPALSLPSILVIRSVIGTRKTMVFIILVAIMATITGLTYGALAA
jgi:uncharacterized membrane protein YraQ (UPF0718 family)